MDTMQEGSAAPDVTGKKSIPIYHAESGDPITAYYSRLDIYGTCGNVVIDYFEKGLDEDDFVTGGSDLIYIASKDFASGIEKLLDSGRCVMPARIPWQEGECNVTLEEDGFGIRLSAHRKLSESATLHFYGKHLYAGNFSKECGIMPVEKLYRRMRVGK